MGTHSRNVQGGNSAKTKAISRRKAAFVGKNTTKVNNLTNATTGRNMTMKTSQKAYT